MATHDTGATGTGDEATVITAWEAIYSNVLTGRAGEQVEATARVENWRETPSWTWRWCRDSRGREGWAPEALLAVADDMATLREDYDAHELTVAVGARVTVERTLAGWALCHTADGARGWVPLDCLASARCGASGPSLF